MNFDNHPENVPNGDVTFSTHTLEAMVGKVALPRDLRAKYNRALQTTGEVVVPEGAIERRDGSGYIYPASEADATFEPAPEEAWIKFAPPEPQSTEDQRVFRNWQR